MAVREAWVYADSLLSRHVPLRPPRWGLRMTCLVLGTVLVVTIIIVVQSLSRVPLFATPWAAAHQASLSFTISWSLVKLRSIDSVMPSNHLILCRPSSPLAFDLSQHQRSEEHTSELQSR